MSSPWARAAEAEVAARLAEAAVPEDAPHMAAYMRDQFPFLGVRSPAAKAAWTEARRSVIAEHGRPTADDLLDLADALWARDEREFQYVAGKALAQAAGRKDLTGIGPGHLDRLRHLITTKSWWDTVDILAPSVVGPLARAHPDQVVPALDRWLVDEDLWLVRSAVLHQLKSKDATDRDRLAAYCLEAADHPDSFVRKAIGWALRQYSYVEPPWVEEFVAIHADRLSPLSRREAMKALERIRRDAPR